MSVIRSAEEAVIQASKGKRVVIACKTHESMLLNWNALRSAVEEMNASASFKELSRVVLFDGPGRIWLVVISNDADTHRMKGIDVDMANEYALSWPDIAARIR